MDAATALRKRPPRRRHQDAVADVVKWGAEGVLPARRFYPFTAFPARAGGLRRSSWLRGREGLRAQPSARPRRW